MSLPHTVFACDKCKFSLFAGPDRYENQGQLIWGRLAACLACGEEQLIGADHPTHGATAHAVFEKDTAPVSKTRPGPIWRKTAQACELLPWFATGAPRRAEWVDVAEALCVRCNQPELRFWLFHGIECPACKLGSLREYSTE
ncbi:hypothetical protein [Rhizobacter sp. P5_C2]